MSSRSYSAIWLHLIWSTKKRAPLLTKKVKYKVYNFFRDKAKELNIHIDHINGIDDHVHLLVCIKPTHSASTVAKKLKGASSKWINEQGITDEYFEWQAGYAAFSVSPTQLHKVRAYIRNQEKHHAKTSFADELIMLENKANSH